MDLEANLQLINDLQVSIFVAEKSKVAYVPVTKAGSTTMLRILAEMEGFDVSTYRRVPEMVHERATYPLPLLPQLDLRLQEEILTSPEWLRLCVHRNPFKRLYSTWEDKLLIGRLGWDQLEGPALVEHRGGIDIGASFRAFVTDLAARPQIWMSDPHFAPQLTLARPEVISYSEKVPTAEIGALIERLSLRSGVTLERLWSNSGLGLTCEHFLDDETSASIIALYGEDFAFTGTPPARPTRKRKRIIIDPIGTRLHSELTRRYEVLAEHEWNLMLRYGEAAKGDPRPRA